MPILSVQPSFLQNVVPDLSFFLQTSVQKPDHRILGKWLKHSIAPAIQDHHFFIETVWQDRCFLQIATLDYHVWRKNNNDNHIMQSDLWMQPSVESIIYNKKM